MRFSLEELHQIARAAGVPDPSGIPLSALMAATALEESGGDPMTLPGDNGKAHGLLQVHEKWWPEIAAKTKSVARWRGARGTDFGKAIAMVRLAKPILEDAARQAVAAGRVLEKRGFASGPVEVLMLTDAAWRGPGVLAWAESTATGYVAELDKRSPPTPGRLPRVRRHLTQLGVVNTWAGLGAILAYLGLGGVLVFILWAIGEWDA